MNAVGIQGNGQRWGFAAVAVAIVGFFAVSAVSYSSGMGPAATFEEAHNFQHEGALNCANAAPRDATWQEVRVELDRSEPIQRQLGSSTLAIDWVGEPADAVQWISDVGVDAVIIEGSDKIHLEQFEAEGFAATHHFGGGPSPKALTFCYDHELSVNQDANPTFERVYRWKLKETAHPTHLRLGPDSQGSATYRLTVTKGESIERHWQVRGTITIDNLTPEDAVLEEIVSQTDDGVDSTLDCGVHLAGHRLEAGESLRCNYVTHLPDGANRQAFTTVKTRGVVQGDSASAAVDFSQADVEVIGDSVEVTDSRGHSWSFDQSATSVYRRVFNCDKDAGLHSSMARIVGTDTGDSTTVTVDCQPHAEDATASEDHR